ncbi:MAG: TetR family transcriptional regulator [Actinomycetota bacterium]|nr:TetR family transcriptional regulator [Actinomycetota bacterium]
MAAPEARDRILEAACDLIAAEGIDEVRIARVANRARASTSLVHHYFDTREELLEQALLHSYEQVGEDRFGDDPSTAEAGAAEAEGVGSATAGLARAIHECLPLPGAQERGWVLWVELWLRAVRDPELRPIATKLYARYREWMAGVIRAGVESGEFRAEADPEALADEAMALLDGAGVRALIGDPGMDIEHARALVARTLAEQLGIEAAALGA